MTGIIGKISSRSKIVNEPLTDGGILLGSGAEAITATAALADSEMLVGDGTTDPAIESGATLRTSIGLGNVTNESKATMLASPTITGTTTFSDGNITNVGDIALDTISSDAGTSIGVTLGTDSGDDFNVGSGKFVVEGDTGRVGIGTATPSAAFLDIDGNASTNWAMKIYNSDTTSNDAHGLLVKASNGTGVAFQVINQAGTSLLDVLGNGKVGIGRAPTVNFDVLCNIYAEATAIFQNNNANALGINIINPASNQNNTSYWFVRGEDEGGEEFKICSDGSFEQTSDRNLKENIVDVESMLDKVNSLRVVNYNRIGDESKGLHIGAIAQEVEEVFPHLIRTNPAVDAIEEVRDEEGNITTEARRATEERYMMYKIGLIFPLIKSVQELSAKVTALESA